MREASSLVLSSRARRRARVRAYDPVAEGEARKLIRGVAFAETAMEAIEGADAVVLVTEWPEFAELDLAAVAAAMKGDVLVDGRNLFSPSAVRDAGLVYEGIGRAASSPTADVCRSRTSSTSASTSVTGCGASRARRSGSARRDRRGDRRRAGRADRGPARLAAPGKPVTFGEPPAEGALVVCLSYDGQDASALEHLAAARGPVVAATTGGPLAAAAREAGQKVVPIPAGFTPSSAVGYWVAITCGLLARAALNRAERPRSRPPRRPWRSSRPAGQVPRSRRPSSPRRSKRLARSSSAMRNLRSEGRSRSSCS